MRIGILTAVVATLSLLGLATASHSADVAKIGVVDFQKILETSNAGKAAQAEINKHGKKMEEDLKQKGAEIEEMKKRIEREALVISKEMREEKEREFRIKVNDLKALQKKFMADFKQQEATLVKKIQKEVFELVETMGKAEGFLMIVERREGGVLYAPNTIDITDKLIQKYNAKIAK